MLMAYCRILVLLLDFVVVLAFFLQAEMDKTKEISLDGFVEIVQDYAEK